MNKWASGYIASANANGQQKPLPPVWPFPTKSPSEYRRVDQGWDLQYSGTTPVPIRAMQSGKLTTAHDPTGFGVSYPVLQLDQPIEGHSAVYYGHTFPNQSLVGKHVSRGQVIGHTGGVHSGGNAFNDPNWLELRFFPPGSMGAGSSMKRYMLNAKPSGKSTPTQPGPTKQLLKCPGFWESILKGPAGVAEYYACHQINSDVGNTFIGRFISDPVDYLERAGLIFLGVGLIWIGIFILAKGPVERVAGEANGLLALTPAGRAGKVVGISPEARADRQRRLELAEKNASIGERRIAVKEAKERRLGGTF